ncbi:hypothetical protein H4582DRAFT_2056651 [Lactarius indigo]|nr:hypothetical protein H4582DRAFT_2056651 [Lactarius indigo]
MSTGRTKPATASVKSGCKKAMLDPFGTNSKVGEEAKVVWRQVFPAVALDQEACEILTGMVHTPSAENVLNNWHSNIGKASNSTIAELWSQKAKEEDISFSSLKHHVVYVTNSLQEMCFMYKNPDVPGSRGVFCLDSVLKVYAKHLQRILAVGGKYGLQIEGLALVTVVVEHRLMLLSDGKDGKANKDEKQGKPVPCGTRGNSFTDNPWGKRAHEVVQSAKRLTDYNWEQIEEHTTVYLQSLGHDLDEGCREDNEHVHKY